MVAALFLSRVALEIWAWWAGSGVLWYVAGGCVVGFGGLGWWLGGRWQGVSRWLWLLGVYVVFPEMDFRVAVVTAVFVALLLFLSALPFSKSLPYWFVLGATAVFFLILYTLTLAPDLLPADNGEFQLIAANLGVAHPPGFPLYTILAHLMTRLPIPATPAFKVNLFSVLTSTLTLAILYHLVYQLTQKHIAAITAVFTLGTATTFWAQATTANIRSLTGLFTILALYVLIHWQTTPQPQHSDRALLVFITIISLGIAHHASLVFMGVWFGICVLWRNPAYWLKPRHWIRPFLATLPALLPLFYLPWRATAGARGATPGLLTLPGFLNHVLALGFRGDFFYFRQPAILWERFKVMGNVLTFQFSPWLILAMCLGFLLMWRQDRWLTFLLGGAFAIHTFITATYRAPQTVEYMLPAYIPLAISLGYAAGQLTIFIRQQNLTPLWQTGLLLAALWQGWQHFPSFAWQHTDHSIRDYTQPLLQTAPPDAIILADWHWATPLWYLQEVEGQRPDVEIRFVFPTGEPYAETWARRIREELTNGRSVIATHYNQDAYATLPPPEPLAAAFLFRQ
ncbi:MAG: DUF2723 domain-containing protein, partial [Chloroflexi bacterium]